LIHINVSIPVSVVQMPTSEDFSHQSLKIFPFYCKQMITEAERANIIHLSPPPPPPVIFVSNFGNSLGTGFHKRRGINFSRALLRSVYFCLKTTLQVSTRTSRPTGCHSCFVNGRSRVQISAWRPAILTEDFRDFPQSLQAKFRGSTLNYPATASFHILSTSLFINHRIIRRCVSYSIVK
jgi:hypothetical protein